MRHLSDEQLQSLASKVVYGADFTPEDQRAMLHIYECEECYTLLRSTIAVMEITGNMDLLANRSQKEQVIINVVILNTQPLLEQYSAANAQWCFMNTRPMGTHRSDRKREPTVQILEDIDNRRTFVAYDPNTKVLAIQVDISEDKKIPKVYLRKEKGEKQEVAMKARGDLLFAEITGLEDGNYQIILEK